MKDLLEAVSNVTDWYSLGVQLGLTMSQLRGIELTYPRDGLTRLKAEMFNVWLKSSPNASWTDLITALRAIDEHRVANDIEAVYTPGNERLSVCVHVTDSNHMYRWLVTQGTCSLRW